MLNKTLREYFYPILSSSLGNIFEWYDFGLFTIFSVLFSQLFFPTQDAHTAIIAVFSVFLLGFVCRPIGALIFGSLGDRWGRAATIRLSILMISMPTLMIGLLPTYHQIGIAAPILLTLTRIWQGISLGGEYSGNIIYLAETAPRPHRAVITSLASVGANLGILLASVVGLLVNTWFPSAVIAAWGWRVPFLISGVFCILMYIFRLHLRETKVFIHLQKQNKLSHHPIRTVLESNFSQVLRTVGIVCMGTTFYYFTFIYMPLALASQSTETKSSISMMISICIGLMMLLVPFAGMLCDRFGRRKMLLLTSSLVTILVVPGYYFLEWHWLGVSFIWLFLFTIISSLEQGVTSITAVENFPLPARYTGLSLGYNLGNGLLGGTVPIICAWLSTYFPLAPAIYIALCALITGLTIYFFVPESKNISLE